MNNEDRGTLIAAYRRERGLTQKQLAGQLGVTVSTISSWESGKPFRRFGEVAVILNIGDADLTPFMDDIADEVERAFWNQETIDEEYKDILLRLYGRFTKRPSLKNAELYGQVKAFHDEQVEMYTQEFMGEMTEALLDRPASHDQEST